MTVLSACQSAGLRLTGERPATVFSTADRFPLELADIASETAAAIAKAHDWRRLMTKTSLAGDGTTIEFDPPADFDRLPIDGSIYSSRTTLTPMIPAFNEAQWLEYEIEGITPAYGTWILLGGRIQIRPVLAVGESAQFYYMSKNIIRNGAIYRASFASDSDEFLLPERLLTLGVIWRWRAQKRLEYAEDLENYQIALNEEIGRDRGSQVLQVGVQRAPADAQRSYYGNIIP